MTHKFDAKNKHKLDNDWRRQHLPPFQILETLGLAKDDIVADIGCGIGYFTIPACEIVKASNKIYALDISEEMLQEVERRAAIASVSNIIALQTKEYALKLPDETVTFGLMVNVLHEVEDKARFLEEIKRILKAQGKLALIEWEKKVMSMGPPLEHRLAEAEVLEILQTNGFVVHQSQHFADSFYAFVATKK